MTDSTDPPLLVVMGPSGVGKSTLAAAISRRMDLPLLDADDLHSSDAIAQLRAGRALTDEQRKPWLEAVAAWIDERRSERTGGVVACSALARSHRDVLRRPELTFIDIEVPAPELARRVRERIEHFASPALLDSQLARYEAPQPDERAITIDGTTNVDNAVTAMIAALRAGKSRTTIFPDHEEPA